MKPDITTPKDIKLMVNSFYDRVNHDPKLSYIFNDFANVNWEDHLPTMYSFWNNLILGESSYKGNPFTPHMSLPIKEEHFNRWIELFSKNIDELFEGPNAEDIKLRAKSIAYIFSKKLDFLNKNKTTNNDNL